jgi:CHASE3 domain sensor protein
MISPEARATIDALSRDDLRLEIEKGHRSRFQRDNYAYAKSRLVQLEEADERGNTDREHTLMEEANRIAQDANRIAVAANRRAITANWIAIVSAVIAIVAVIVSVVFEKSSAP